MVVEDINRHVDEDKLTEQIVLSGQNRQDTRKFKHWVTAEVLLSIRKYGIYAIDEILVQNRIRMEV